MVKSLLLASSAAVLLLLVGGAAAAGAGTYTVSSCQTPAGAPAGVDGWSFGAPGNNTHTYNNCGHPSSSVFANSFGGVVDAGHWHSTEAGAAAKFSAPAGTHIQGYTLWRAVQISPSSTYRYTYDLWEGKVDDDHIREYCRGEQDGKPHCSGLGSTKSPLSNANRFSRSNLSGVDAIWLGALCRGSASRCEAVSGAAAQFEIYRADFSLRDDSVPVITSAPTGPLVSPGHVLTGVQGASLGATDSGGGVYQAVFEVDGKAVAADTVNSNGGHCQQPFIYRAPCPTSTSGTVHFDTSLVPDGHHNLRILVTDATGTNAAAYGPVPIHTQNAPCRLRAGGSSAKLRVGFRHGHGRATVRYGGKRKVSGRLTDEHGAPIAGAPICVGVRRAGSAALAAQHKLVTNRKGRFSFRAVGRSSRTIRFVYRAPGGGITADSVGLRVRSPVALKATHRVLRNGQSVLLRGRLRGRPIPRGGALVELQAHRPGSWQTFGTVNTDRRGRFSYRYRFTRTTGLQRYALRALAPRQAGYPYVAGGSHSVTVTVHG